MGVSCNICSIDYSRHLFKTTLASSRGLKPNKICNGCRLSVQKLVQA